MVVFVFCHVRLRAGFAVFARRETDRIYDFAVAVSVCSNYATSWELTPMRRTYGVRQFLNDTPYLRVQSAACVGARRANGHGYPVL